MQLAFREWDNSGPAQLAAAALGGDEVQLWIAAVPPAEVDVTPHARLLSPDERERAARFSVLEARREFVFGRAMLLFETEIAMSDVAGFNSYCMFRNRSRIGLDLNQH